MSPMGLVLLYVTALALHPDICTASTAEESQQLAADIGEQEISDSFYDSLGVNVKSPFRQTGRLADDLGWTPIQELSMGISPEGAMKRSRGMRAMGRAHRTAMNAMDEDTIRPKIPADLMIKIMREVERRRKQGRLNMEDENALPDILSEISPSRSYVSVGLDLKALSRMIAERQLQKFRRIHGANHQKLLKIGK